MPLVETSELTFNCVFTGSPEGTPLVFVHGLTTSIASLYLIANSPELARFRGILYDQRGHGKTQITPTGYDLTTLASDLHGLLGVLSAPSGVALLGHSYGAAVALKAALQHPEIVDHLILADPALPPLENFKAFAEGSMKDRFAMRTEENWSLFKQHPILVQKLIRKLDSLKNNTSIVKDVSNEAAFTAAELAAMNTRTLLISAEKSDFTVDAQVIEDHVPNLTISHVSGGHTGLVDKPGEAANAIREFLNG